MLTMCLPPAPAAHHEPLRSLRRRRRRQLHQHPFHEAEVSPDPPPRQTPVDQGVS